MPFSFKPSQESTSSPIPQEISPAIGAQEVNTSPSISPSGLASRFPEKTGILQIALYAVFGVLVLVTIILFGYQWYLKSQVDNKKKMLAEYNTKLGVLPLEEMRVLSNRLKFINQLVKNHPSVDAAFRILEESVEHPVTYTRFDLRYDPAKKIYMLQLSATAPDYRSVVQQMDTFKSKPFSAYVSDITIDGLHPDDKGKVTFDLKMPIAIMGVLPEGLILTEALQNPTVGASSSIVITSTTTPTNGTTTVPNKIQQ